MKLNHGLHLAYCTNIHRGETWQEIFTALKTYTLAVKERVCPDHAYAIGLRLGHCAAQELSDRVAMLEFQRWLGQNHCYVFTINGFPFGRFHGTRVKERVYLPDWTSSERLDYTNQLFDLLAQLLPGGIEGSVSTVPLGCKELVTTPEELKIIRDQLWKCVEHVARLDAQTGRKMHLGLEPEPLCLLETSGETVHFFDRMRAEHRNDPRLNEHLGVNYDTCHLAVEFEEPSNALECLRQHGIRISKLHLSSALKVRPTAEAREALAAFADDVYLHQVVVRHADGQRVLYRDLPDALSQCGMGNAECGVEEGKTADDLPTPQSALRNPNSEEWRIHFHIPLHRPPTALFDTTADHLLGTLDWLRVNPSLCAHLEMETYTWEVLPPELQSRDVVEQLASEYDWTLSCLRERGLA